MSNEPATTALSLWEDNTKLEEIKKIYAHDATPLEFQMLVGLGLATGLDPFLKEIWFVKIGGKAQIFIGRDGYRKAAQRQPLYDYHQVDAIYSKDIFEMRNGEVNHRYNLEDRGSLVGAYAIIQRKGASKAMYQYVELREYNKYQSVWKEKPATMIKKVAEAQALRMAFQEVLGNTYSDAEDWRKNGIDDGKTIDAVKTVEPPKIIDKPKSLPLSREEQTKFAEQVNDMGDMGELEELWQKYKDRITILPDDERKPLYTHIKMRKQNLWEGERDDEGQNVID